jgi:hypothetical protein
VLTGDISKEQQSLRREVVGTMIELLQRYVEERWIALCKTENVWSGEEDIEGVEREVYILHRQSRR